MSAALPGLVIVASWCAAVVGGLGRQLLGADASGERWLLLLAPGVLIGAGLIAFAALRRLREHAPRWVPTVPTPRSAPANDLPSAAARSAPAAISRSAPAMVSPRSERPRSRPVELAIVHLGARVDPAWAAWGLRWAAPGHGEGFVPLPSGARVVLGRDPAAEVVARLDQVSWQHLELDVQEDKVTVLELGSCNGTRSQTAALVPREPWTWAPGATLELAYPTALVLTLEPLR